MARRLPLLADIRERIDALGAQVLVAEIDQIFARLALVRIDAAIAPTLEGLALVGATRGRDDERRQRDEASQGDGRTSHGRTLSTALGSCNELR